MVIQKDKLMSFKRILAGLISPTYFISCMGIEGGLKNRVHTVWQRPLSGVHSIMMEKLAQAAEGRGGARPPPFTIFTITYKVVVNAPAERAATLHVFHLYPICFLWIERKLPLNRKQLPPPSPHQLTKPGCPPTLSLSYSSFSL
jgi:hypothetical protein